MVEVRRIHPTSIFVVTFVLVQNVDHLHKCSNEPQLPHNSIIQKELKKQLLLYQRKLFSTSPPEAALVGQDICTGLTVQTVKAIVNNYPLIKCEADILALGVTCLDYCGPILDIIKKLCNKM